MRRRPQRSAPHPTTPIGEYAVPRRIGLPGRSKAGDSGSGLRWRIPLAAAVSLLLSACGEPPPPADSGVGGRMRLRQWDRDPRLPISLAADAAVASADLREMTLRQVRMRLPVHLDGVHRGWMLIGSPSGRLHQADPAQGRPLTLELDGPVQLTGQLARLPFAGTAAAVVLRGQEPILCRDLRLVEIVDWEHGAAVFWRPMAASGAITAIARNRSLDARSGGLQREPDAPPGMIAATLALGLDHVPADPAAR